MSENTFWRNTLGPLPQKADVVIIGGGVIGTSIAYYLCKKGVNDVLLLEKSLLGSGATGKCVGGIRSQFSTKINIEFSRLSRKVFDQFSSYIVQWQDFFSCVDLCSCFWHAINSTTLLILGNCANTFIA